MVSGAAYFELAAVAGEAYYGFTAVDVLWGCHGNQQLALIFIIKIVCQVSQNPTRGLS